MTGRVWTCEGCGATGVQHTPGRLRKWCSDRCRKSQYDLVCVDCGGRVYGGEPGRMRDRDEPRCALCAAAHGAVWSRDAIVLAIQEWAYDHDGTPPTAMDWNPHHARAVGHPEKADEFYDDGHWPNTCTVRGYFGSWNAAIRAAGFQPRKPGCHKRGPDPAVIEDTARRYLAGLSSRQIAVQDGVSPGCVIYRLEKAGVPRRPRGCPRKAVAA